MKANKSFEEAILRAHQSTEKNTQPQEQLYSMNNPASTQHPQPDQPQQAPLNESHHNLMQSWHNLRNLEYKIEEQQANAKEKEADKYKNKK